MRWRAKIGTSEDACGDAAASLRLMLVGAILPILGKDAKIYLLTIEVRF